MITLMRSKNAAGLLVAAGSPALEAGADNSPGDHPG
jgi:hypothetical protein